MNLNNYQVNTSNSGDKMRKQHHRRTSSGSRKASAQSKHPSLAQQFNACPKTIHQSDVTICCRIKRPIALGQQKDMRSGENSNALGSSQVSINSTNRNGRGGGNDGNSANRRIKTNNHSTLRSSTQSLLQNNMSARSVRSNHSGNSNAGSRQGSARKPAGGRSSSLMNIYSSNTGR